MRIRTLALVGGWAAALAAATAVSWAGVNLVGNELSPYGPTPLSRAEVEQQLGTPGAPPPGGPANPGSTGPRPGGTGQVAPAATPAQRSQGAQGGTVVLVCTGQVGTAKSAPRPGYTVGDDSQTKGSNVWITFSNGTHRSRIDGTCPEGTPMMTVREFDLEEDD
jgi:hypothetical protein